MSNVKSKLGYCPHCMKNISHVCKQDSLTYQFANCISMGTLPLFRLGWWHCTLCSRSSVRLLGCRNRAPTIRPDINPVDETASDSTNRFLAKESSTESRRRRAKRYSIKFRDNVIRRLISTDCSIADVCRDLDISDADIVDWFADHISRQKELQSQLEGQMANLTAVLPADAQALLRANRPHISKMQSSVEDTVEMSREEINEDTVEIVDGKIISR